MSTNITLSKESSESEIKAYFNEILKLSQSDNEFPVNFDDVWMLVYQYKHKAVNELKEKFIEKTATTLACRLSIKANDYISLDEAAYLLDTIRTCENPFTCPHGRPTIITYSNYELERLFKRVMN